MEVTQRLSSKKVIALRVIASNRGNSMVFPLFLVILFAAMIEMGLSTVGQNASEGLNLRLSGGRAALVEKLNRYAALGSTFRSSLLTSQTLQSNPALGNCVLGGAQPCLANVALPVNLYFTESSASGAASVVQISGAGSANGVGAAPAHFDMYGNSCDPTKSSNCVLEVSSTFTATCPNSAPSCARAQSLVVNYLVQSPNLGSAAMSGTASTSYFTLPVTSSPILVSSILPQMVGSVGSYVTITDNLSSSTSQTNLVASTLVQNALADSYITDQATVNNVATTIISAGITNQAIADAVAVGKITNVAEATTFAATLTAANITNEVVADALMQQYIAQGNVLTEAQATTTSSALTAADIIGNHPGDYDAAQLMVLNGVTDPTQMAAINKAIIATGSFDWNVISQIIASRVTNVSEALSIAATTDPAGPPVTVVLSPILPTPPATLTLVNSCTDTLCKTVNF